MPELGSAGGMWLEWEVVFGCNVTLWVVFTWIAVGFHGFGCHGRGCDESVRGRSRVSIDGRRSAWSGGCRVGDMLE